jgi:aminoglycoside 6'-N-acetyltransferase I
MRAALWPDADRDELEEELEFLLDEPDRLWNLILFNEGGRPVGFAEVQLRALFDGSPVEPYPHLEAIWIAPEHRRSGAARMLLDAIEARALAGDYEMLGSDADLDNILSHQWHEALGFEEAGRQVLYRKPL